jgi:hypothetical protein
MIPPWTPPHPWQPTSTGTTVGFPATVVVTHVFAVQSVFVAASVENPGGIVVIVEDIESATVVGCRVGRVAVADGDAVGTEVGWPSEPIVKDGEVKGGGMTRVEGGSGDCGMIIIPLYPEAHKVWHGQSGSIVEVVAPMSSVVVFDHVIKPGMEIKLVLNTNDAVPVATVVN